LLVFFCFLILFFCLPTPSEESTSAAIPPAGGGGATASWDIAPEHELKLPAAPTEFNPPVRSVESGAVDDTAAADAGPDEVSALVRATSLLGGTPTQAGNAALLALERASLATTSGSPTGTQSKTKILLPVLPLGWEHGVVAESQRVYYFNRETGATSWVAPASPPSTV
jgi:hypothetical protein